MRSLLKRVASLMCVLAFAQIAVAQCAGWQATPEARRACCKDAACPLHHGEAAAPQTQRTQAAVDDCCAQSERPESSPSGTAFASTMTLAVLGPLPAVDVIRVAPAQLEAPWETPSPPTHVPKYLLLSVLLV